MLITTRAIIFRATKYQESSLILDAYTELKGLRKYIISGVRKAKARTPASLLQVMNLVEIVAYEREDREINRLKEVRLAYPYQQIPFDLMRGTLGLFMAEVARKTVRERENNPGLFQFLYESFQFLDQTEASLANVHLHFLLELSTYLGFMPSGEWSIHTPIFDLKEGQFGSGAPRHPDYLPEEKSAWVHQLLHLDKAHAHEIKIPKTERLALLRELLRFYHLHLDGIGEVNSLEVVSEVMR
ncbi:MAG: DNA repair protein RecO [Bacteroidota bacterium]